MENWFYLYPEEKEKLNNLIEEHRKCVNWEESCAPVLYEITFVSTSVSFYPKFKCVHCGKEIAFFCEQRLDDV